MSAPSLVTPAPAVEPVLAPPSVIDRLIAVVGERNVIRERVDLLTYEWRSPCRDACWSASPG